MTHLSAFVSNLKQTMFNLVDSAFQISEGPVLFFELGEGRGLTEWMDGYTRGVSPTNAPEHAFQPSENRPWYIAFGEKR